MARLIVEDLTGLSPGIRHSGFHCGSCCPQEGWSGTWVSEPHIWQLCRDPTGKTQDKTSHRYLESCRGHQTSDLTGRHR